jgi:hypothetical protein
MRTLGTALAVVLLLTAVTGVAAGQSRWYELYDEAIKHIQAEEWQQAEAKLLQARKEGPPSGRNVLRYGSLRSPYFPEYYLGVVFSATNRPKEALEQFQLARNAKIDVNNAEFRPIRVFESASRTALKTAANNPKPGPATNPTAAPPPVPAPTPAPKEAVAVPTPALPNYQQQFTDLMSTARTQLGQRNFDGAEQSATSARDLAIKQGLSDRPRAEALLRDIDGGRRAVRVEGAITRRDVAASRKELDTLVAVHPEFNVEALRGRVDELERELRGADLQRTAMRAFYNGNYQLTASMLTNAEKTAGLTPRGHFYRACSLAALAAGTANPAQDSRLREARRSFALAAAAQDQFRQDLRYISPKIRQLLGI